MYVVECGRSEEELKGATPDITFKKISALDSIFLSSIPIVSVVNCKKKGEQAFKYKKKKINFYHYSGMIFQFVCAFSFCK